KASTESGKGAIASFTPSTISGDWLSSPKSVIGERSTDKAGQPKSSDVLLNPNKILLQDQLDSRRALQARGRLSRASNNLSNRLASRRNSSHRNSRPNRNSLRRPASALRRN